MKTIVLSPSAAKGLDKLSSETQDEVMGALAHYAVTGEGEIKALKGRPAYRLRIGRYRVIFEQDGATVVAIYIGKRDERTSR